MALQKSQELTALNFFQTHRYSILKIFMIIAGEGKKVSGRQLARDLNISLHTLQKLMKFLISNENITSTFGVQGGYELTAKPEDITMLDMLGFTINPETEPHGIYEAIIKITDFYETITLANLIEWDK
jgi:predicted transcriptional regulator